MNAGVYALHDFRHEALSMQIKHTSYLAACALIGLYTHGFRSQTRPDMAVRVRSGPPSPIASWGLSSIICLSRLGNNAACFRIRFVWCIHFEARTKTTYHLLFILILSRCVSGIKNIFGTTIPTSRARRERIAWIPTLDYGESTAFPPPFCLFAN